MTENNYLTIDNVETVLSTFHQASSNHLHGLVDMGSNGIRFSISDLRPPLSRLLTCIYHERAAISLYDALHKPELNTTPLYFSEHVMALVSETLRRFLRICEAYEVPREQILIFATEAMRTAKNADEMLQAIKLASDLTVKIISPEVETLFGAMGARSGFAFVDGLLMDLGGGSVQVAYVNTSIGPDYEYLCAKAARSLPFGAAKLTDALSDPTTADAALAELRKQIKVTIDGLVSKFPQLRLQYESVDGITIYLTGGGFRGYGSMLMHTDPIQPYPISAIGGYVVSGSRFANWPKLLAANKQEGKIYGLSNRRRRQFQSIAMVVDAITRAVPRIKSGTFCTGGNREGVLFMELSPAIRETDPFLLMPTPIPKQDACSMMSITSLLMKILPSTQPLAPAVFTPHLLSNIVSHIWVYQGLDGNNSRSLYTSICAAKTALPSLTHDLCAILALTLSARWGLDLGPVDLLFAQSLQKIVEPETAWWCQYIGTACHFLSIIFASCPTSLESLNRAIWWQSTLCKMQGGKKYKQNIKLEIILGQSACQGSLEPVKDKLKTMWKQVGQGLGVKRKVKVDISINKLHADVL